MTAPTSRDPQDSSTSQLNSSGFTLIELLLVVVIIGVLAAIAIPGYEIAKEQALMAAMKSDLRNLAGAQETYFHDHLEYTSSIPTLNINQSQNVTLSVPVGTVVGWRATAAHSALPSVVCEMYYGTAAGTSTATTEGVVACNN